MGEKEDVFCKYNESKYKNNTHWKIEDIVEIYKYENPSWTQEECFCKAKRIYREIKRLNRQKSRNNALFFRMNTPFSFFDNKDSEFADKPWGGSLE